MIQNGKADVAPGVVTVPEDIDIDVARIKLETLGISIDLLTEEQKGYAREWRHGT